MRETRPNSIPNLLTRGKACNNERGLVSARQPQIASGLANRVRARLLRTRDSARLTPGLCEWRYKRPKRTSEGAEDQPFGRGLLLRGMRDDGYSGWTRSATYGVLRECSRSRYGAGSSRGARSMA